MGGHTDADATHHPHRSQCRASGKAHHIPHRPARRPAPLPQNEIGGSGIRVDGHQIGGDAAAGDQAVITTDYVKRGRVAELD